MTKVISQTALIRAALLCSAAALAACDPGSVNPDMRGAIGGDLSTTGGASAPRPQPDSRGVITYPDYQVAVAQSGDTVASLGARLGQDVNALARANGLKVDSTLRDGELLVLAGPVGAPTGEVDITALASDAIDRSTLPEPGSSGSTGSSNLQQPVRHKVERGETAYTIARQYNVSPRALSDWNGLGPDLAVREGQFLLIPISTASETVVRDSSGNSAAATATAAAATTTSPGEGSATPVPPSATKPLPEPEPVAEVPEPANLEQFQTQVSDTSAFAYPVSGRIIRPYKKGSNDGIGISANAGAGVQAAEQGEVAAITQDTDQVPILVLRHPNNLLTVYANVADIKVKKGDKVSRGQNIASVASGDPSYLHFEIRQGVESVDPVPYLE
jgi:murein DD-endopeptidase MepM/ murein hydrolase activator NlpD